MTENASSAHAAAFMEACIRNAPSQGLSSAEANQLCGCVLRGSQSRFSDAEIAEITYVIDNPNQQISPDSVVAQDAYGEVALGCLFSGGLAF